MKKQNKDVYEIIIKENGNIKTQYETDCAIVCGNQDGSVRTTSWASGCDRFTLMYVAATALGEVKRLFKDQPELFPVIKELALKIDKEDEKMTERENMGKITKKAEQGD